MYVEPQLKDSGQKPYQFEWLHSHMIKQQD